MDVFFMNLEEKLRIDFPEHLDLKQSENLLNYLAEELRADISYNISHYRLIAYKEEGVKTFDRSFKISGKISLLDNFEKFESFIIDSTSEIDKAGKLEFFMVPGWDINDYGEKARELWGYVRESVRGYFTAK